MTVSAVLIVIMAVLFACGVYAMLERSLTRVLIGFLLLGNAANLLLLIVMGPPGIAPFFGDASTGPSTGSGSGAGSGPSTGSGSGAGSGPSTGSGSRDVMSDPLPQALTLTAIVITFAVSAFLLALIYRSWQLGQADTVEDDTEDRAVRERGIDAEDTMDDDDAATDDTISTDFEGGEGR